MRVLFCLVVAALMSGCISADQLPIDPLQGCPNPPPTCSAAIKALLAAAGTPVDVIELEDASGTAVLFSENGAGIVVVHLTGTNLEAITANFPSPPGTFTSGPQPWDATDGSGDRYLVYDFTSTAERAQLEGTFQLQRSNAMSAVGSIGNPH